MKVETEESITNVSEGRFLPRFVRYFAASSILGGAALFVCGITLIFERTGGIPQITIAWALAIAAMSYGVYLLILFPDVRIQIDRKAGKALISQRRLVNKQGRELELRRITTLLVERSEGSTGKNIFRIAFRTYKGEIIPLSGSWTEDTEQVEADAKKLHACLDPNCSLELPAALTLARKKAAEVSPEPPKRATGSFQAPRTGDANPPKK